MYKQHKKMIYQAYILISMQMNNWFNYRNYLDTDGQAAIQRKGEQIAMYICHADIWLEESILSKLSFLNKF